MSKPNENLNPIETPTPDNDINYKATFANDTELQRLKTKGENNPDFINGLIDTSIKTNGNNSNFEYMPMFGGLFAIGKEGSGYIFNLEDNEEQNKKIMDLIGIVTGFIPFAKTELKKPENSKYKFYNLLAYLDYTTTDKGNYILVASDPDTIIGQIITRAAKQARATERAANARAIQAIERNNYKGEKGKTIHYNKKSLTVNIPTTKLMRNLFDKVPDVLRDENGNPIIENGKLLIKLKYSTKGKPDAFLTASITPNFFELDYGYDFFVICTLDQLYKEGNNEVTLSQILKRMGITPSTKELEKLYNALVLGSSVHMRIDNNDIIKKWGIDRKDFDIITSAVMFIQIKEKHRLIDGNLSKLTIVIGGYSPFYQVGDALEQIGAWDNRLLELYTGYRTPKYWRLMRYLIREVGYMRSSKKRNNILDIKNIYDFLGDISGDDYESTRKTIYRILEDCFIKCHYITGYSIDNATGNIILDLTTDAKRSQMLLKEKNDKK